MRLIRLFLLIVLFVCPALAENVVLMNGIILDGTGKARFTGNVRIRDGKIMEIGLFRPAAGETLLDVKGLIVAPGFIDLEGLSVAELEKDMEVTSAIAGGVTTAILGSDGTGPYLVEEFMQPLDDKPLAVNIAMLVGHATVRRQIMGADYKRAAREDEVRGMVELVETAMRQGAFGLASDLRTVPALFSTTDELSALAKAAARFGGTLLIHPRDEKIQEALDIARNAKMALQLSLNTVTTSILAEIEKARLQGLDVGAHIYKFTVAGPELRSLLQSSSTAISLNQYLRDDKVLTLERAIQKLAGLPAARLSLKERGALRRGIAADIIVFNSPAPASGLKYVFVNGTLVFKDGQPTGARPGQALR